MQVTQYTVNEHGQTYTRTAFLKTLTGQHTDGSVLNRKATDAKGYHNPLKPVLVIVTRGSVTITHWQDGKEVETIFQKGDGILFTDWDLELGEKEKRGHRSTPGPDGLSQVSIVFPDRAVVEAALFGSEEEALAAA